MEIWKISTYEWNILFCIYLQKRTISSLLLASIFFYLIKNIEKRTEDKETKQKQNMSSV